MAWFVSFGRICLCIALLLGPVQVQAGDDMPGRHGLMWHRSGLPAVFPLQVKTLGPQDYYVTLTDAETDKAVLAAYIEGGRFFRVLVPPGTFEIRFVAGNVWQGEDDLFGPGEDAWVFDMPEPLTFGVRNFNTKGGHLVDLRDLSPGLEARVMSRELLVCQGLRLVAVPGPKPRGPIVERFVGTGVPRFRDRPLEDGRIAEALDAFEIEDVSAKTVTQRDGWRRTYGYWRYEVRANPC